MMIATPGKPIQADDTGSLDGASTIMVRTSKNMHWAAVFNSRPRSSQFQNGLDSDLWKAADEVGERPQRDLFERYR